MDSRFGNAPLVWEYSDLEESFQKRRYSYIFNLLCVLDEEKYDKIFFYDRTETKLGYDVYLKYDKFEDYIKISFLTSHMVSDENIEIDATCSEFIEMVRYPSTIGKHSRTNNSFLGELIRERAGRILDNFFLFLLPENQHNRFKIEPSGEHDPLDGIGNFKDNPEYINGGFFYFEPAKNDFIYDLQDEENNRKKSAELYDGNLVNHNDEKVKNVIIKIADLLMSSIDTNDSDIYNGIKSFVNNFFNSKKGSWVDYNDFKFRKTSNEKVWNNRKQHYEHTTVIQYKNKNTKKTSEIDFGHQHHSGDLHENPSTDERQSVIETYLNIDDKYLQACLFLDFIKNQLHDRNSLASEEMGSFIDILMNFDFPEKCIDDISDILDDTSEKMESTLFLYISFAIIPFHELFYMYSKNLFEITSYYLNAIVNDSISHGVLRTLLHPFSYAISAKKRSIWDFMRKFLGEDINKKNLSVSYFDYAIRILNMHKVVHQKHSTNMMLRQILSLSGGFRMDISTPDGGIRIDRLNKLHEIMMLSVIIFKLDNSLIEDSSILPHYIFDICKFYIKGYRYSKHSYTEGGIGHTIPASKYDINIIAILNLMINRMSKKPEDQSKYVKVIKIVNHLVGGRTSWVYKSYTAPMKVFAFFMLNTDRLDEHLLDRYYILIKKLEVTYPSICGLHFDYTIKNVVITKMMPLLWQKKMTDEHFDALEVIAEPFSDGVYSKNDYEIVKNQTIAYLTGI